ncbi:MAG: hypothetical protein ABI423_12725, partial [Burkholderiales bacterium]
MSSLLLAAAIVAAAGGALEVSPARTEAAGYAVTHALVVRNLVKNCGKFKGRLKQDPDAALETWRSKNAEHVLAAESYLVAARIAVEKKHGPRAGEDFHAQTHDLFVEQANRTLNDIFGALGPQPAVCERWVESIAGGQADLNWQSKYMPILDELREFERSLRPGGGG